MTEPTSGAWWSMHVFAYHSSKYFTHRASPFYLSTMHAFGENHLTTTDHPSAVGDSQKHPKTVVELGQTSVPFDSFRNGSRQEAPRQGRQATHKQQLCNTTDGRTDEREMHIFWDAVFNHYIGVLDLPVFACLLRFSLWWTVNRLVEQLLLSRSCRRCVAAAAAAISFAYSVIR